MPANIIVRQMFTGKVQSTFKTKMMVTPFEIIACLYDETGSDCLVFERKERVKND